MTVRLLKVVVQPVFVAEQNGDLIEVPVEPVSLTAAAFKGLDPSAFAEEGATAIALQLEAGEPTT